MRLFVLDMHLTSALMHQEDLVMHREEWSGGRNGGKVGCVGMRAGLHWL